MITKSKVAAAVAALALAASLTIPSSEAEARGRWGVGLAAGLIGGAMIGAAIANSHAAPVYVDGYRRCRWVRQYDDYGFYVGTTKVCRYY